MKELSRLSKVAILLLIVVFFSACSTTQTAQSTGLLTGKSPSAKVVVMPIDIELSALTATGMLEPRADWTEAASGFMYDALIEKMKSAGYQPTDYNSTSDAPDSDSVQLEKLHEVVGQNIVFHNFGQYPLPSKDGAFDWSLGSQAKVLGVNTDADHALFVYFRDSFSTGGRVAAQIGLAMLGVGVVGGQQIGFVSMVDLDSGDIVWFNFLNSLSGDSRTESSAISTMDRLMQDFPER